MGSIISRIDDILEEYGTFENYLKSNLQPSKPLNMDFKIIHNENFGTDLLVRRDITDDATPFVAITFFALDEENEEYQVEETVEFETIQSAQHFVADFSERSAEQFILDRLRLPNRD